MKLGSTSRAMSKLRLCAIALCLSVPTIIGAQEARKNQSGDPGQVGDVNGTRTIEFDSRGQFACGEIVPDRTGGFLRYEISFNPRTIERCELEKVGSRLHDCERFNINVVTTNVHQINSV